MKQKTRSKSAGPDPATTPPEPGSMEELKAGGNDPGPIALIELGGSHDECMYSQVLFMKDSGYPVHVLLFDDHFERMERWSEVDHWKTYSPPAGYFGEWKLVLGVRSYLLQRNIRRAVINTAEGNIIRKLSLACGRRIEFTGLIHLSRKLWTSRTQKIISRKIKKYFVLTDFISKNLGKAGPGISIEYFYPVYFPAGIYFHTRDVPDTEATNTAEGNVIRSTTGVTDPGAAPGEFLVCIPGAVDYARRDYPSLLEEIRSGGVPPGIRFLLLGRTTGPDGRDFISRMGEARLEGHFITFDGFVDHGLFYRYLSASSLVLPLITPGAHDYQDYLRFKITGSYNLAWGFAKAMLMHDSFEAYPVFRKTSFFYRSGKLIETLESLAGQREKIRKMEKEIQELPDFNFRIQAERYRSFLSS
jgi:hypothetical protein